MLLHSTDSLMHVVSVMVALAPAVPDMASLKASARVFLAMAAVNRVQPWQLADEQHNATSRDSSFSCAPEPWPPARVPRICATTSRGDEPYIAAGAVFSASEHGTFPSPREVTPTPSPRSCRVLFVKIVLKRRD